MAQWQAPGRFDYSFDAFDFSTWYFESAPMPWYRGRQATMALIAVAAASVAIVVSGVLLMLRGPSTAVDETSTVAPPAPSTVASTRVATSVKPSQPAPAPATSAEPAPVQTPVQRAEPRVPSARTTKEKPEIGVMRTPHTRSPISVAPQLPRGAGRS